MAVSMIEFLNKFYSSNNFSDIDDKGFLGKYRLSAKSLSKCNYYVMSEEEKRSGKNLWNGYWTGKNNINSKEDFLKNHDARMM